MSGGNIPPFCFPPSLNIPQENQELIQGPLRHNPMDRIPNAETLSKRQKELHPLWDTPTTNLEMGEIRHTPKRQLDGTHR